MFSAVPSEAIEETYIKDVYAYVSQLEKKSAEISINAFTFSKEYCKRILDIADFMQAGLDSLMKPHLLPKCLAFTVNNDPNCM